MSNRAGANSRASKYDYLIKLLLIGDSGKIISLVLFVFTRQVTKVYNTPILLTTHQALENHAFCCVTLMIRSRHHLLQRLVLISR